jgi:hypothetical protein
MPDSGPSLSTEGKDLAVSHAPVGPGELHADPTTDTCTPMPRQGPT